MSVSLNSCYYLWDCNKREEGERKRRMERKREGERMGERPKEAS